MAWGALADGARAATGSTGQGLSLMQESFSEITLAELPLVIFNMARGQGDYFQSTRGGGHGDYRHLVLAPVDIAEAVELTQLAFHLAERWRNPVLLYGDYLTAHVQESVDGEPDRLRSAAGERLGRRRVRAGTGHARLLSSLGLAKAGAEPVGIEAPPAAHGREAGRDRTREARAETGYLDDAETVVVAFGTPARFVRSVVRDLRADGERIGYVRPITLWPFPSDALAARGRGARTVACSSSAPGQMIDDVRLAVLGQAPWSASAASRPTAPASASAASSTPSSSASGCSPCTGAAPTPVPPLPDNERTCGNEP